MTLAEAAELARSGDVWLFRGHTGADRAIRLATNAPVNHVAMAVVIDDLPAMMWHAELGKRLLDLWTGTHHRGAQLHDLQAAVTRWTKGRGQQVFFRQLTPEIDRGQEDALLQTIARWNGTSFPSTARLARRWLTGRRDVPRLPRLGKPEQAEAAYCAELAGITYEAMGVLEPARSTNWYDPGKFWSGDQLPVTPGFAFGGEIEVIV